MVTNKCERWTGKRLNEKREFSWCNNFVTVRLLSGWDCSFVICCMTTAIHWIIISIQCKSSCPFFEAPERSCLAHSGHYARVF